MTATPALRKPDQDIYRFPNGYGASVITNRMAYGGRELAVIKFDSESIDRFQLVYDTPITSDVLGSVSDEELAEALAAIEALPFSGPATSAREASE